MIRVYELRLGGSRHNVKVDPQTVADWWDGPQAQCEIMVGTWVSIKDCSRYRRHNLPGFRPELIRVGYVLARYQGGRVGYRDVELCPEDPAGGNPLAAPMAQWAIEPHAAGVQVQWAEVPVVPAPAEMPRNIYAQVGNVQVDVDAPAPDPMQRDMIRRWIARAARGA